MRNKQRGNQIFLDKDEDEGSCARSRVWRKKLNRSSQDVSTFLSGDTQAPSLSHVSVSSTTQVPQFNTSRSNHFPDLGQFSRSQTPLETTAHKYSHPAGSADGPISMLYSHPAGSAGDPISMVSQAQSASSDDSTYLEEDAVENGVHLTMTANEGGSSLSEKRLICESSVNSSTVSPVEHFSHLPVSCNYPQADEETNNYNPDSSQGTVQQMNRYSFIEELVGDDDETRLQCTTAGNDRTGRATCCPSSDKLSDLVACMSVEEDQVSSSSCEHGVGVTSTNAIGANMWDVSSLPNASSAFSHPQPTDTGNGQSMLQFKPSSFSTPVHGSTHVLSNEGVARVWHDSTCVTSEEDSVTRLEDVLEARADTPLMSSTTYLPTSPPKSILKKRNRHSLEQCWDDQDEIKPISKCVTFNLPHSISCGTSSDSDLAMETPLELWRSLKQTTEKSPVVAKRQVSNEERNCRGVLGDRQAIECDSVLTTETPVGQWFTPHMSTSLTRLVPCNISDRAKNIPSKKNECDEDLVSVLALETPVEQWQSLNSEQARGVSEDTDEGIWQALNDHKDMLTLNNSKSRQAVATPAQMWLSQNSVGCLGQLEADTWDKEVDYSFQQASLFPPCGESLPGSEDCGDVVDCHHHAASSSILAPETPCDVWTSLNTSDLCKDKNLSSVVYCTANRCTCRCSKEENITSTTVDDVWRTQTQSSSPMCILAMETPLHMWTSPTIKLIDNTFKQ